MSMTKNLIAKMEMKMPENVRPAFRSYAQWVFTYGYGIMRFMVLAWFAFKAYALVGFEKTLLGMVCVIISIEITKLRKKEYTL